MKRITVKKLLPAALAVPALLCVLLITACESRAGEFAHTAENTKAGTTSAGIEAPVKDTTEIQEPAYKEAADGYTKQFEIFHVDEKDMLAGELGQDNGLCRIGHGSVLEAKDGGELKISDLKAGMIVELTWNGNVQESYPGQFSYEKLRDTGETGSRELEFYVRLLKDLAKEDPGLNEGVNTCYVDLSEVSSLTKEEKAGLAYICGGYYKAFGVLETEEELAESGILDPVKGLEEAILITVKETPASDGRLSCSARKYRSGTGAYYFEDVTAVYKDGEWSYKVGSHMIS